MNSVRTFNTLALTTALLVSGCADLSNIKKFAATSADSAGYTSLVSDYEKSAERLKGYEPPEQAGQLDKTIAERKAQQKPLLDMLHGIQEYMNAVGSLASDQLVSCDKSLTNVSDALKATKAVGTNQADAFEALSALLARAATDAYRQDKLKMIIRDANPHFQKVIQAMTDIVSKDFVASLDAEKIGVDKYYSDIIETAKRAPPQDAAIELVKESWRQRVDDIEAKRQACEAYAKILETIGKGHQALYDNADHLSSTELLSTIDAYATAVSQSFNKLKQLK